MKQTDAAAIDGYWEGVAIAHGSELAIRMHFVTSGGGLTGTIDFPSWNSLGCPLNNLRFAPPFIHWEIPGSKYTDTFDGKVEDESIFGELITWGRKSTVQMKRTGFQLPYRQEEVRFKHEDVSLAGTLLLPLTPPPHPAVVFVHGSGDKTRDEYRGIADHFARYGLAALIYDKRGTGESTGDWKQADFADYARDVLAAVNYLQGRKEINPMQIGVWGMSQGGWVVILAASLSPEIAFVITVSDPVGTAAQQMRYELETRLRQNGFAEREIAQAIALKKQLDEYARFGKNRQALEQLLNDARQEKWFAVAEDLPYPLPTFEDYAWYRGIMDFEPVPLLKQLNVPLLAIYGEKDALVDASTSVALLEQIKAETGQDITVKVFAKANHSLTVFPESGEPFRWFGLADGYLDTLITWVQQQTRNVKK